MFLVGSRWRQGKESEWKSKAAFQADGRDGDSYLVLRPGPRFKRCRMLEPLHS